MKAQWQLRHPTRVLLVEDNPGDVRLLRELLGSTGEVYEIAEAATLAEATAQLASGDFDITLADLSLPDSRGADTVARLRASSHRTAIVVMTAALIPARRAARLEPGDIIRGTSQ